MLFDLQSPGRKTAVRIIFGFLALIFATGFIFLGIGTEGGFNPFYSAGGGSTDDQFEQLIEDAEAEVEKDPADSDALANLAALRTDSAYAQLEFDETGQVPVALTDASREEYEEAISIWEQYLESEPRKVDLRAASGVVQGYQFLGDIDGAIEAQRALAESNTTDLNYGQLANLLYRDLQIEQADKARDKALAEASSETKQTIAKQLAQIRKQAVKAEEQQKKQEKKQPDSATGESPELSDPFGGLSGTDPVAPAP